MHRSRSLPLWNVPWAKTNALNASMTISKRIQIIYVHFEQSGRGGEARASRLIPNHIPFLVVYAAATGIAVVNFGLFNPQNAGTRRCQDIFCRVDEVFADNGC